MDAGISLPDAAQFFLIETMKVSCVIQNVMVKWEVPNIPEVLGSNLGLKNALAD
jgi:hypothetical protein